MRGDGSQTPSEKLRRKIVMAPKAPDFSGA
jgi:hypothetical protein